MTESAALPQPLAQWVEPVVGPAQNVRDASHERENSRVWEVAGPVGRHFVKVAPQPLACTRETRAYRAAVPRLGFGNAPVLKDSSADLRAMVLTAVDGQPLKEEPSSSTRRAAHTQAGRLLRRFHDAYVDRAAQTEAVHVIEGAVAVLDKHLAAAGDHLSAVESDMLRRRVSALPSLGPLPAGLLHGDFRERNFLWDGWRCALIDLERSAPVPPVADLGRLATAHWPLRSELRAAFFDGYGRALSDVEEPALVTISAADAASALVHGPRHGDPQVTERGRRTVERRTREERR
ncbi:aminoglycoside phosphotransferase family protein [Streptomyces sp. NPDC091272]|uniref:aminoglycoside phosphotransferase family protein n=1 Tax=Streptomyces sp. NPDC091272 TaxID=3365981 RepID=UPI0038178254